MKKKSFVLILFFALPTFLLLNSCSEQNYFNSAIKKSANTIKCHYSQGALVGFSSHKQQSWLTSLFEKHTIKSENQYVHSELFDCKDEGCTLQFINLSTASPQIVSNGGAAPTVINRDDPQALLLLETTVSNTINLYRIFLSSGMIVGTKNAQLMSTPSSGYGVIYIGQCEVLD